MPQRTSTRYEAGDARAAGPAFTQVREAAQAMVAEGQGEEAFDFLLSALAAVLRKSLLLEFLLAFPWALTNGPPPQGLFHNVWSFVACGVMI